jgi:hypothetical protein
MRLFKMRVSTRGGHVHCRVFVAFITAPRTGAVSAERINAHPQRSLLPRDYLQPSTWANIGTLVMSPQDWTEFQQQLNDGTKNLFQIEPDDLEDRQA